VFQGFKVKYFKHLRDYFTLFIYRKRLFCQFEDKLYLPLLLKYLVILYYRRQKHLNIIFVYIFSQFCPQIEDNFLDCFMLRKARFPDIKNILDFNSTESIKVKNQFAAFFYDFCMLILLENNLQKI
jgi:hypothetical protein